jgi:PAS domain S-box-containing protein
MLRLPPIARISLGLVSTTLALMIVADVLFGLSPDHVRPTLDARKRLTETLAIQVTALINSGDIEAVQETLRTIVERQPDVLSSGVRLASGPLVVKVGDHDNLWKGAGGDRSTPTHARVKIHHGAAQWGTLEVRFQSLASAWSLAVVHNPFVKALVFVSLAGFAAYLVFMRRTLRHLDPASVIPERVKATLDLLSEGVVIADEQDRIVLVNKAFEEGCGISMRSLLGRDLSSLPWHAPSDEAGIHLMPWHAARRDGTSRTGTRLELGDAERRVYAVNSVPMLDDRGQAGGVMVTFDDLTELESTHLDLRETMHELQRSRNEIAQQNERLEDREHLRARPDLRCTCRVHHVRHRSLQIRERHVRASGRRSGNTVRRLGVPRAAARDGCRGALRRRGVLRTALRVQPRRGARDRREATGFHRGDQ